MKICKRCKLEKPFSEFYKDSRSKDGKQPKCKKCSSELGKEWNRNNKDYRFQYSKIKSYGISIDKYNELFKEQRGRCAICNKHQSELSRGLFVDHDHKDNTVRGLLCSKCNSAIARFSDNEYLLLSSLSYLLKEELE